MNSYSRADGHRYGIVGDGKVARHVARYLSLLRLPYRRWSRGTGGDPMRQLAACRVILVLIDDAAIEGFVRTRLPRRARKKIVHFSGALSTPLAEGVHPLMTFGPDPMSLEEYEAVPFVMDRGGTPFAELFPGLRNPHFEIPRELKPFYHSLCVMSGNFTTMLWQKLFQEFEATLGLPRQAALPYLRKVCENLSLRPATALTGPWARGDGSTIRADLAALERDPYAKVYRAFMDAAEGNG